MIEVNDLTASQIKEKLLQRTAQLVLEKESASWRKEKDKNISIALVGPKRMRELNKDYRNKDRATDVLAFSELEIKKTAWITNDEDRLGEIIICPSEVRKNAQRFGVSFEKELSRVLIHGILHLFGYDHERSKEKAKEMEEKQEYYLSKIFSNQVKTPQNF